MKRVGCFGFTVLWYCCVLCTVKCVDMFLKLVCTVSRLPFLWFVIGYNNESVIDS
jgi:hypothetical protein